MIILHIYNLSFSIIAGIIQTEYKSIQFPVFRNVTPGINPILPVFDLFNLEVS